MSAAVAGAECGNEVRDLSQGELRPPYGFNTNSPASAGYSGKRVSRFPSFGVWYCATFICMASSV
jgi:hypothetical protein